MIPQRVAYALQQEEGTSEAFKGTTVYTLNRWYIRWYMGWDIAQIVNMVNASKMSVEMPSTWALV